jgi:hypothetical protein
MQLTPILKFAVIAFAFVISMATLAWNGIQSDLLAIGMRQEVHNIVATVLGVLSTGSVGLLAYLGLKAPTIGESVTKD